MTYAAKRLNSTDVWWPPLIDDFEEAHGLLNGVVADKIGGERDHDSVIHGEGHELNEIMEFMRTNRFPENRSWLKIDLESRPQEVQGEEYRRVGDFVTGNMDDGFPRHSLG